MSSDEAEVVTHVLRTSTDYYAMLKVGRSATVAEIKTSYKRMALRLHPDKNKHARAEECFKLLGKAHTTLSDEQKRAVYDRGGEAAVQQSEGNGGARNPFAGAPFGGTPFGFQQGGATFRFHTGGDDFVEDLFGMFFGGGMDPRMHQQRRAHQQQQQQARAQQQQRYQQQQYYEQQQRRQRAQQGGASEGLTNILQFLPIILFLIVAMVLQSSAFDPAPAPTRHGHHQQQSNVNLNQGGGAGGRSGADTRHRLFTLVADEYHPHERVTTLLDEEWVFDNSIDGGHSHRERGSTSGLRVSYFVNSHMFDRHVMQRRMSMRSVEEEVAKSKKESLERLCKTDQTMAKAAKKKKISSVACDELEDFAPLRL